MKPRASIPAFVGLILLLCSTAIGAQPDKKGYRIGWLGPAENRKPSPTRRDYDRIGQLVINQKAAKALGMTVPSSLRLQATHVIE